MAAAPVCHMTALRDKTKGIYLKFLNNPSIRLVDRNAPLLHYWGFFYEVYSSPEIKAELDRLFWGLNTMKSCLVPPNLKNAGVNALANTRNFGELEKENAEQMCQQAGEGRHKENHIIVHKSIRGLQLPITQTCHILWVRTKGTETGCAGTSDL